MKDKSNKKVCEALRDKSSDVVKDGITRCLNKALELRPDYDDAMAYLQPHDPRTGGHPVRDQSRSPCGSFEDGLMSGWTKPWPSTKPRPRNSREPRASPWINLKKLNPSSCCDPEYMKPFPLRGRGFL